ncbi:sulfite exporter TauE/SafE family protein [Neisseria sp.]|uniref:sulfite exporter TauE/SafE family protein n=1 Tax=Neisseria sp. TaxID=192066 RepID=UPI0035A0696A
MWNLEIILSMLAAGALSGFIAGLFGVGGGMILVPVMLWVFKLQGLDGLEHAQHLAVGTSFAVMVFTTFSSMLAQHRKQSVDWHTVARMSPGMILGVLAGALIARYIPNHGLQVFFIFFTVTVAVRTITDAKPKPSRQLPATPALTAIGGLFGVLSSWVGIGGGSLSVPFLLYCNVPPHRAVGTSSGLAWPIAVAGALGYLFAGWNVGGLPEGSVGFWYLPAVAVLSLATMACAPIGVKAAHKLPPRQLKLGFGILLLIIAASMAWKVFA